MKGLAARIPNTAGIAFGALTALAGASPSFSAEGQEQAGHASGPGFPQLDTTTWASQVFWLAVFFVLLYVLMSKIALPRVGGVIEARRARRQDDLDRAEHMSAEAGKVRHTYEYSLSKAQEGAQDILTAAGQAAAEKLAAETARFAQTARARMLTAEENIAQASKAALESLADISAELAAEMVGKITGTAAGKDEARQAVAAAMKEG